ncbi:phosphocholine-specific phospholipase C [Streptomyces boluensis]|uniref:phospholipase C n=1 Tax=Streptomyces boluensis TaxID=1775135 RepID=A0A964UNL1_9ACTN|nr:phospholipase C, phosphocholine-specific [Streptomyces boluensis]NBE52563.1 phospholipase C, phosphocholine-specific [Streptomyces boluensis]
MSEINRRNFLQMVGGAAAMPILSETIARAAEVEPHRTTGTPRDVKHIVILMQENRSFDHYLGTLKGVRGFGDPRPAILPNGKAVWHQAQDNQDCIPFRPDDVRQGDLGFKFLEDIPHDWNSGHAAWNGGRYDQWVAAKDTRTCMMHYARSDIPFHHALADTFTVCDAYYSSLNGWTDPNRYYMWTGWVDPHATGHGTALDNFAAGSTRPYTWTTYPERLQKNKVSWKIYQDIGHGLTEANKWGWTKNEQCIGNYGDNSLLHFQQFQNAASNTELYKRSRSGSQVKNSNNFKGLLEDLRKDVRDNTLPQVSWIAAPEAFNEHPKWPAEYGSWYIAQVLEALLIRPEVWSETVLLVTYDENGGFFDHVVPPSPAGGAGKGLVKGETTVNTDDEHYLEGGHTANEGVKKVPGPFGLGPRVPVFAISPWSRGGYVCSDVFDHTSLIRFIETCIPMAPDEPHISAWRREVCGDLTTAFDFAGHDDTHPPLPNPRTADDPCKEEKKYQPSLPSPLVMPQQEAGQRPARALPYDLAVDGGLHKETVRLTFRNNGARGAVFRVSSHTGGPDHYGPWSNTVGAHKHMEDVPYPISADTYDLHVHGPNGFLRQFAGPITPQRPEPQVTAQHVSETPGEGHLSLTISNRHSAAINVTVADKYAHKDEDLTIGAHESVTHRVQCKANAHWYEVVVTSAGHPGFARRLCGHIETGRSSHSDPAFASIPRSRSMPAADTAAERTTG